MARVEFARQYLELYAQWGGPTVSLKQFLDETAIIVRAQVLRWLWQMFSDWDATGSSSSGHWTHEALKSLVHLNFTIVGWDFARL